VQSDSFTQPKPPPLGDHACAVQLLIVEGLPPTEVTGIAKAALRVESRGLSGKCD